MPEPVPPPVPDWAASTPDWPGPADRRSSSAWAPPAWTASPVAGPTTAAAPIRSAGPLALGLVALAGVAAGAVGAAFLVTAVFLGSAEDIGEGIGRGMVAGQEEAVGSMTEEDLGWSAGPPLDPADIGEPTAPVTQGDPVLDGYAQRCFEGDYQACDDLFYESPPLSDHEDYGQTCGGRVKPFDVMACTELE